MFLIISALLLANGTYEDYKESKFICDSFQFGYMREADPVVYASIAGRDYKTKYNSIDGLTSDIKRQCAKERR